MEFTQVEKDYLALYEMDVDSYPSIGAILNRNGGHRITICPCCSVDDFVHVGSCGLIKKYKHTIKKFRYSFALYLGSLEGWVISDDNQHAIEAKRVTDEH